MAIVAWRSMPPVDEDRRNGFYCKFVDFRSVNGPLERIKKLNPHLHAYATVMAESTMKNAELMDRELSDGRDRGPPYGMECVYLEGPLSTHSGHSASEGLYVPNMSTISVPANVR